MRTVPRFFGSPILVVAIVAHPLGVVLPILVTAAVHLFTE